MPVSRLSFCYDERTEPPHPIIGSLETETFSNKGSLCEQTSLQTGISMNDIGIGEVYGDDAEKLIGNSGVPAGNVIDLANIRWTPDTKTLTMAYKPEV